MTPLRSPNAGESGKCDWPTLRDALTAFVLNASGHQSQGHIRPLHHYVACRLVVEGGFAPDDITPRPPFVVSTHNGRLILRHDPTAGGSGERTVLGGLKTKAVDVVVTKPGIGPVLAVSMKGTLGAFRNLTNRMEEAIGDCTNLHIAYPALVYGFFQVLRATRAKAGVEANDACILEDGTVSDMIRRYHDVLARLAGRDDLRDDSTKYEAVSLSLVDPDEPNLGAIRPDFPSADSQLAISGFFDKLYRAYDLRFVYAAPKLEPVTARSVWDASSPALADSRSKDYVPRVGEP